MCQHGGETWLWLLTDGGRYYTETGFPDIAGILKEQKQFLSSRKQGGHHYWNGQQGQSDNQSALNYSDLRERLIDHGCKMDG